jgi:cation transport ATPase
MLSPSTSLTAPDELAYRVEGMSCSHCVVAVTEEVSRVSGVASVTHHDGHARQSVAA